jgi:prophage regulatory protein
MPRSPLLMMSEKSKYDAPQTSLSMSDFLSVKHIMRKRKVSQKTGLSGSTIDNRINPASPHFDPEFPLPIVLSNGTRRAAKGWRSEDIDAWIDSRPSVADAHQFNKSVKKGKSPR